MFRIAGLRHLNRRNCVKSPSVKLIYHRLRVSPGIALLN